MPSLDRSCMKPAICQSLTMLALCPPFFPPPAARKAQTRGVSLASLGAKPSSGPVGAYARSRAAQMRAATCAARPALACLAGTSSQLGLNEYVPAASALYTLLIPNAMPPLHVSLPPMPPTDMPCACTQVRAVPAAVSRPALRAPLLTLLPSPRLAPPLPSAPRLALPLLNFVLTRRSETVSLDAVRACGTNPHCTSLRPTCRHQQQRHVCMCRCHATATMHAYLPAIFPSPHCSPDWRHGPHD